MLQKPPNIPEGPGSYQFKSADGRIIYVGKARSLRQRLANYFQDPGQLHPRTAAMVEAASSVEWIEVRNEVEALMLEYSLIKQYRPRFNVRLRDDKSYPYLAITTDEEWPRAVVMRGAKRKGVRYFGPYAHAWAIRDTLDLLLRSFPVRTCSQGKYNQHQRLGRPCLLFHIEKCSGPCVGEVTPEKYREYVSGLSDFLGGDTQVVVRRVTAEMNEASKAHEFEQAARLRDRLGAIQRAVEKQQMVAETDEDIDVLGIVGDELEAAIQVFFVRKGRVTGRRGFILDKVEPLEDGALVDQVIEQMYGEEPPTGVPKLVLVPFPSADEPTYVEWLSHLRGSKVEIKVPQRGDKVTLLETVSRNASEELARHRLRRASDHNARSRALTEIQDALGLPEAPLRIECYDMAHLQGTDYVGSMVVMEDGLPLRSEYRRFKVKDVPGNNDYAAMEEVLRRRLTRYIEERDGLVGENDETDSVVARKRPKRFAYPPQLLLVDGGKGQLGVAVKVVQELGLENEIPVAALAKRFEEVYVPNRTTPVELHRGGEALFMLQCIRDEAHRFANRFHAELRDKRMRKSELDGIAGLGVGRKTRLLKEAGSLGALKKMSRDDLRKFTWLPELVANNVYAALHPES